MIKNDAVILTLKHGDSLFLLKNSGICAQKVMHGVLSDKIVIWVDENELKTEETTMGYVFPGDGEENSHKCPHIIQREHGDTLNVIPMSIIGDNLCNLKWSYHTALCGIKKRPDKWEHYIFIPKEEKI